MFPHKFPKSFSQIITEVSKFFPSSWKSHRFYWEVSREILELSYKNLLFYQFQTIILYNMLKTSTLSRSITKLSSDLIYFESECSGIFHHRRKQILLLRTICLSHLLGCWNCPCLIFLKCYLWHPRMGC